MKIFPPGLLVNGILVSSNKKIFRVSIFLTLGLLQQLHRLQLQFDPIWTLRITLSLPYKEYHKYVTWYLQSQGPLYNTSFKRYCLWNSINHTKSQRKRERKSQVEMHSIQNEKGRTLKNTSPQLKNIPKLCLICRPSIFGLQSDFNLKVEKRVL